MLNLIFISIVVLFVLVLITKFYEIYKLYKEKLQEEFNLKNGIISLEDIKSLKDEEFVDWGKSVLLSLNYEKITFIDDKYILGSYLTAIKDDINYIVFLNQILSVNIIAKLISSSLVLNNKNLILITSDNLSEQISDYINTIPLNLNFQIIDGEKLVTLLSTIRKKELSLLEDFSS
ncbi:hypothetical protein [Clostridium cellulovorans]|uniref:Restriction endonuclease type IV Mrr domain-containing protein n=1 Tax=Clostridium cellulovorans (strain ATCC 35296 / DSM 3052 / OCM 3 / 743B) TaxID=573061 RepID=D9SRD3_CLOC7|nr:hypothetical protein [Clostridium cellulovorans]ADL52362.1 hypothetical protein Clocel_2662 [Clostridium cellulovorans 743B]